jgi:hypothetical protein
MQLMQRISDAEFAAKAANIPDAPQRSSTAPRYRRNARHWAEQAYHVPLDRNARARLLHAAEALEARTRQPGRQNGSVSRIGLLVLRCLMLQFLGRTGRCDPAYDTIMRKTGLCRQSVRNALFRLERAGLVRIMRRLTTAHVSRQCHITGNWQSFLTTVQTSNAYAFDAGVGGAEILAPPATDRGVFPQPSPGGLLDILHPSLKRRLKTPSSRFN